jgi:multisubunit Na+/H+ antiporter MnhG subunit
MNEPVQTNKNKESSNAYRITLITVVTQVGCLTPLIILGALFAGLWLDRVLATKPIFTIIFIVISAPVSVYVLYRIVKAATNRMKPIGVVNNNPQSSEEETNRGA